MSSITNKFGQAKASQFSKILDDVGGPEGMEKILRAFYGKMSDDIMVGFFFDGKDLEHVIQMQKSFLLKAMGVSQTYSGKLPKAAHEDLAPILRGHFNRRMVILRETLESFKIPQASISIWLSFEEAFRPIVSQE